MKDGEQPKVTPAERVQDLPRILRVMRKAVREALLRHKEAGNPVAIWRNGRVEWLAPKDIPVDATDHDGPADFED